MNVTDNASPIAPKIETSAKKMNWFERHPGPTLALVIVCAPFILWGIVVALIMLATLFPIGSVEAFARYIISATLLAYIAMVIMMVLWYRQKTKKSRSMINYAKNIGQRLDNADAYYKRADTGVEVGEYGQAIADYSKVIELDPRHASAYFNRAYAYGEIGEYNKAIADYSKAIELDPNDAQAYYNRALDYQNKCEVLKAVSDLEKCLALSTDPELTKDARQILGEIKNSP